MAKTGTGRSVVVIGGGWAGCAAAVTLARQGVQVTLLEAARTLGGRARRVELDGRRLDNGQHILLGAYRQTLSLLSVLGVRRDDALLPLPLQMRYPPGSGGMDFVAPRLPAPLHLLVALLRADGLARADKMALARFSSTARWAGWRLTHDCSVAQLLTRWEQTPRLIALMWRPLCIAALNTPPERASAQVFLNVLRDSLGARRAASDMLIPKVDLSALLPDRACAFLRDRAGTVETGFTVDAIARDGARWRVQSKQAAIAADAVVVATGLEHAAQLLGSIEDGALAPICADLRSFTHEAITTCYLQYDTDVALALPFFALLDDGAAGHWGQFVFDRGQLDATQAGLLAVVVSASHDAIALPQAELTDAIAAQLAQAFGRPAFARPLWSKIISEKRATFACTPALRRPANASGINGLVLAGDYTTAGDPGADYPATLESAVASGVQAAASIMADLARRPTLVPFR